MTWLGRGEARWDPGEEPLPWSERSRPPRWSGAPSPPTLSHCTHPRRPSSEPCPVPGRGVFLPSTQSAPCTHLQAALRKGVMRTAKMLRSSSGGWGVGWSVLQLPCGSPFPPLPLCLITGTPRGKQGLFWAVISSQEVLPFPASSLYFFFLHFRNTKATPHTCPFVQKIMPS